MNNLIQKIVNWGISKGILQEVQEGLAGSTHAQLKKLAEETIETTEAYTTYRHNYASVDNWIHLKEELGDIGVVWIMACSTLGLHPEECLQLAYEKIKERTGTMKNGQFVKD